MGRVIEHERRPTPTRHDEREQHNNEVYGEEQYHGGRQEDGHRRNEACGPVFVFVEPRSCAWKIIHFPWSIQQQHQGVALEAEGSSGEEATEEEQNMETTTTTTTSMTTLSDEARKIGEAVAEGAHAFTERYDVLSAFSGSMCVTGYCVLRGQEPWTALMITATATVTALVINELMEDPM